MENVLFLQSEVRDPHLFYSKMRSNHPVYYDEKNKIWAVYTYKACEEILQTNQSSISKPNSLVNKNDELKNILSNLARLSNGEIHAEARAAAINLMSHWRVCDAPTLLHSLMGEPRLPATFNWVSEIAIRLPVFALLKGFDFSTRNAMLVLSEMENLVKLMTPVNTDDEVNTVLKSVRRVKELFNTHFHKKLPTIQFSDLYIANFIGLLIQSYDATRGMISNSLLHLVNFPELKPNTHESALRFVKESTRLDPPVHNTRRIMYQDIKIGNRKIKKGEQVLVVLASANRDLQRFINPELFDVDREVDTLSFGLGIHKCVASNFSTQLTASLLYYLSTKYSKLNLLESEIQYEARINVRLPKKITLIAS